MDPGHLRHWLTLESKRSTRDAIGGEVITWAYEFSAWGEFTELSGRELMAAQQKHAEITVRFIIRFRDEVTSTWRVVWEGRAYQILAPPTKVDGRRQYLSLECQSFQPSGT